MNVRPSTPHDLRHPLPATGAATCLQLLLIEDNAEFSDILTAILALENGLTLSSVGSVAEALEFIGTQPPDLILLDLGLPDSDGLATLTAVQRAAPGVPIVVLTGADDEQMGLEAMKRGAQDYLLKTEVGTRSLVRALGYALERHAFREKQREHAEEIGRRHAEMKEELKLAGEIQQSYLSRQRLTFPATAEPQDAALRFCFRYAPADLLGGDFFAMQELPGGEVSVIICDVMGHGVSAALISATVRGLIEEMKTEAADPCRFLSELNRALHAVLQGTNPRVFVTAFYMVVNLARSEVRYANAGHPAPFFIRPATRQVRSLETPRHGTALGLLAQAQYTTATWHLHPGDLILLFTDGLYEIESPFAEIYGRDRLPSDIRKRIKMTPAHLLDELLEHIRDFSLSRKFTDDVCLLGMEVGAGSAAPN